MSGTRKLSGQSELTKLKLLWRDTLTSAEREHWRLRLSSPDSQSALRAELKKELHAWRKLRPRGQFIICEADTLQPLSNDRANRCFWQPMRHTEWCLDDSGRVIEVALPWGLLNVGDPSTRSVVDDKSATRATECTPTAGIGLLGWATASPGFSADSLGPTRDGGIRDARPEESHFIGPAGTTQTVVGNEIRINTPVAGNYVWNGWNEPITKERVKLSAMFVKQAFEEMEVREQRRSKELDAQR